MTPSLVPIFRASFPDGYAHVGGMYMYQNYYSNMNGDISLAWEIIRFDESQWLHTKKYHIVSVCTPSTGITQQYSKVTEVGATLKMRTSPTVVEHPVRKCRYIQTI